MGADHWSEFWQQGHKTTFGEQQQSGYSAFWQGFWAERFASVGSDAHILDIGTGNGALLEIARAEMQRRGQSWRLTGVDIAEVQAADEGIELIGNCPVEQLSLADSSVDLVCSQYGIEYSEVEQAFAQLARVLLPGGRFEWVCHHSDSAVCAMAAVEIPIYQQVFDDGGLFDGVIDYLAGRGQAALINQRFNEFAAASAGEELGREILAAVKGSLAQVNSRGREAVIAQLQQYKASFHAAYCRLQDLQSAALSAADVEHWFKRLNDLGFNDLTALPLDEDGQLLAWQLSGQRLR